MRRSFRADQVIAGGLGRERKVRTPEDSRLVNDQAGRPDGIVQQRTDSPKQQCRAMVKR